MGQSKGFVEYKEIKIAPNVLAKIKIKVKEASSSTLVWSTENTTARHTGSIWAPEVQGKLFKKRKKLPICIGYYFSSSLDQTHPKKNSKLAPHYLEITDEGVGLVGQSAHLENFISSYFPWPKKYSQVWSSIRSEVPIFCWRPIPPTQDFVALGMVCTTTPEEPDQDVVRCVPRMWVKYSKGSSLRKAWDDSGLGGKAGSIFVVNSLNLAFAIPGHDPNPQLSFYDIWSSRFHATEKPKHPIPSIASINPRTKAMKRSFTKRSSLSRIDV